MFKLVRLFDVKKDTPNLIFFFFSSRVFRFSWVLKMVQKTTGPVDNKKKYKMLERVESDKIPKV